MNLEHAIIGAALHRPELVPEAGVLPADFNTPRCAKAWESIIQLRENNEPVTPFSVEGDIDWLLECQLTVPTGEYIEWFGKKIKQARIDRQVRLVMESMATADEKGEDLLARVNTELSQIELPRGKTGRLIKNGLLDTIDSIEKRCETRGLTGIPTGLASVDGILGGLQRGVITVVAARPSAGKSSMAAIIASKCGVAVDYYSLEDTEASLHMRMLAQLSGVGLSDIIAGNLQPHEWQRLSTAAVDLSKSNIHVIDDLPTNAVTLADALERLAVRRKTDLIVVDYFQLLRDPGYMHGRSRADELGYISNRLASIARNLDCALLLVAQLRRDAEEGEPQLRHLKDSGQIEQDAYAVLMLERTFMKDSEGAIPVTLCHIRKNKNGPTDTVPLRWDAPHVKFSDADFDLTKRYERGNNDSGSNSGFTVAGYFGQKKGPKSLAPGLY